MGLEPSDERVARPGLPSVGDGWVSATATRNYLLNNTLIDWLDAYGEANGFVRDTDQPGYDERLQFSPFIMSKGIEFELAIAHHLAGLAPMLKIAEGQDDVRDPQAAAETIAAMRDGQPIIHQGVLHDGESMTYGAPDFLVRSDVLAELFPGAVAAGEVALPAPALGGAAWHYRVVDAKFTTLHLLAGGDVGNSGSAPAYKGQLYVYNRALGQAQGYEPEMAFLMGRGWARTRKGVEERGFKATDRLGPVTMDLALGLRVDAAVDWVRRLRREGGGWTPLPEPSVPELWPNMGETDDFPWHAAKSAIASQLDELTLLWYVGPEKRDAAHRAGITRWTDPRADAATVGVTGASTQPTLQAVLDVNHAQDGPVVMPAHVRSAEDEWRPVPGVEFFVDFETVNNLDDDFSKIPGQNGQPLIFMIGCGHREAGEWVFRNFTVGSLTEDEEEETIDAWLAHMGDTAARLASGGMPRVIHWSFAEPANYEVEYNSARKRHPDRGWPSLRWFDLWKEVVREEPVVVRGALSFGLKAFARAMHAHGLIETSWGDSQVDGLGAMVGAWRCDAEAREHGLRLMDIDLMREIAEYNEVDCKVMMEILAYLRAHH